MVKMLAGHQKYRILAVLWMLIIFWLSSQPDLPSPSFFSAEDKVEHLIAFGILGLLFALSLGTWRGGITLKQASLVTFMVAAYGAIDECHQLFVPGRCSSVSDFLADLIGGALISLILYLRGRSHFQTPTS